MLINAQIIIAKNVPLSLDVSLVNALPASSIAHFSILAAIIFVLKQLNYSPCTTPLILSDVDLISSHTS